MMQRIVARMQNRQAVYFFEKWSSTVSNAVAERERLSSLRKRAIQKFKNRSVVSAFETWLCNVKTFREQRVLLERFGRRLRHSLLGRAFHGWHTNAHEAVRNRTTVKRFLHRLQNRHLVSSFETWEHRVQERKRVRHIVKKVFLHMCYGKERAALRQWQSYSIWHRKQESENSYRELLARIAVLENALHERDELIAREEAMIAERDRAIEAAKEAAQVKFQHGLELFQERMRIHNLRSSVHQWIHRARQRRLARRVIFRLCHAQLASAFLAWRRRDQNFKEELRLRKIARQQQVEERARKQAVAARALRHFRNREMASLFRTWQENVTEAVRQRTVLNRFVRRWQNQDKHRVFYAFVQNLEEKRRRKAKMKEVYRRLMYGMESSALDIWKRFVSRERQRSEEHIWSGQLKHLEEQKKQEMEAMRMQYEMQLKQLQTHAEEVQQARLRKFISHWRGKSEEKCFHHIHFFCLNLLFILKRNGFSKNPKCSVFS